MLTLIEKIFYSKFVCLTAGYLKLYEFAINILILVISPNWWDGGVALQQGLIISQIRGVALPHGQHPTTTGLVIRNVCSAGTRYNTIFSKF